VAVLVGLLLLTRPDQLGLAAGALLWTLRQSNTPRHWAQAAAWALGPAALWALGALVWTGSPVPNPTLAKLGAGVPQAVLIEQGLGYLQSCAAADPLAAVLLTLGLGLGLWGRAGVAGRLMAVGGLLQLAVVVLEGGDFMLGRFLSPTLVLAVLLLAHAGLPWPKMAAGALISAALIGAAHPRGPTAGRAFDHRTLDVRGVADERGFYFQTTGWWPRLRDGRPLPTPAPPGPPQLTTMMNVGLDGFLAGPSVHIVDPLALTDPLLARLPADCGGPCRPGHLQRAVPEAHLAALASGAVGERGGDALGALQRDVWWMTRGALLSAERWRIILRRRGR
jgi:arabinofuranosyltransferase